VSNPENKKYSLYMSDNFFELFGFRMRRGRYDAIHWVANGHNQNGFFILRQVKCLLQLAVGKVVAPGRVNALLNGPEHDVGRRDAHILHAGVKQLPIFLLIFL
jgi:hypothetical protein